VFKCTSFLHGVHYGLPFPGHPGSPTFFVPEFPGMKLSQLPGTCCKANLLQRLNDCYLMPAKGGREGGSQFLGERWLCVGSFVSQVVPPGSTVKRTLYDAAPMTGRRPRGCH